MDVSEPTPNSKIIRDPNSQSHSDMPENDSLIVAQAAANGDKVARKKISEIVHPMIAYQTNRFCKRFCKENRFIYQCTLDSKWTNSNEQASLCEWGNASYGWMLDDLTNNNRLLQFNGANGARINDYLYRIANSLPFYERWKDWRFGRKVHVPTYIQDLAPDAAQVYLAMRNADNTAIIAQKINKSLSYVDTLAQQIIVELTKRNRLYLLDPPTVVSLSQPAHNSDNISEAIQNDIASYDQAPEVSEEQNIIRAAWDHLSAVEQFVLEAMLIENQDANDILIALKKLKISIKEGVSPEHTNRQQLYYFRRKTIAKLAELYNNVSNCE